MAPVRYPDPSIKILDPRFAPLVLGNAAVETIATGCLRIMPTATPATGKAGSSPARWMRSG